LTDAEAVFDTGKRAYQMFNLILYAVPYFVALLAIEWVTFHHTGDHDDGRIVNVTQERGEFHERTAAHLGAQRQGEVADHVNVVTVRNR